MEIIREKINDIQFLTVKNDSHLEVCFSSLGASIYYIKYDNDMMTVSPRDKESFINATGYYGRTLGRVGGRIKDGRFRLHGNFFDLEKNEGPNCLHSGSTSISFQNFIMIPDEKDDGLKVVFLFTSEPNEGGFPGSGSYVVKYFIPKNENFVEIQFEATCDQDTIFNMSNHSYFNLGNEPTILNHFIKMTAEEKAIFDNRLIVQGYEKCSPIFDFRKGKLIGQDYKDPELHGEFIHGYDNIWKFNKVDYEKPCVIAKTEKYQMDCFTDFDSTIMYISGFPNYMATMGNGVAEQYKGFTMEFMGSIPEIVDIGNRYKHRIKYSFKKL